MKQLIIGLLITGILGSLLVTFEIIRLIPTEKFLGAKVFDYGIISLCACVAAVCVWALWNNPY